MAAAQHPTTSNTKPRIERPTKTLERPWPWVGFTAAMIVLFGGCVGTCALGPFESIDTLRFGPNLRGYTFWGLTLGILSVVFAVLCFWYSIRKRRDVAGSSMMSWLWSHVWFGVIAIAFGTMHGGCGLISASFSSGKLLFLLFVALAGSGIFWRRAYASVPKEAAPQVLNYSREGALRRAEEQLLEIEKLSAGKSTELHRIKEALLIRDVSPHELVQLAQSLPPTERPLLDELVRLAQSRRRALGRPPLQEMFTQKMQKWRSMHVPLSFAFVLFLFFHILGAFEVPRKSVPLGLVASGPLAPFRSSTECKACHLTIYNQWKDSMHAHALTSPLTIVQNNLDMRHTLKKTKSPDPRRMCINCHGPAIAAITDDDTLPLRSDRQDEGIECVACHQLTAATVPGGGALASAYQSNLSRGDTYFGQLKSPIGNAFHKSDKSDLWRQPDELCATCHDVNYDKDGDGRITKGKDLVLQTTYDEYRQYRDSGGRGTCMTCHMPSETKKGGAADSAIVPFEQDYIGSDHKIHDHSFVGVDYPLDTVSSSDPQKAKRKALLASAASFDVETRIVANDLILKATIGNQSGHSLPTGFAFARQMWIEVVVRDGTAREIFSTGLLAEPTDDLCDAGTFGEASNPLRPFVRGCDRVDRQLVNIQLKLVDKISSTTVNGETQLTQPLGAHETFLQFLTGGGVPRTRPLDSASLAPLKPNERRSYSFGVSVPFTRSGTYTARLMFRNLPPYWVRAMAREQPANEVPRLEPLVANIQTVIMAERSGTFSH